MLDPMETCEGASGSILPEIKTEDMTEYEKHPYKMVISRDHSFVLANNNEHTHHMAHYGQHGCPDTHHHPTDGALSSNQLINTGQIEANGYYCSFF